jgi:hypothetical protein
MNHDCRPNANYFFDRDTFTHQVHAVRAIYPGEEITISYINPIQSREKRLKALKRSWGFDCRCSQCTAPAPIGAASDARLAQLEKVHHELSDTREAHETTPEMAEFLVSLYEQERLWGDMLEPYSFAALEYNGVGNAWMARKYARLAVEAGLLHRGRNHVSVTAMEALLSAPEEHWSWKRSMVNESIATEQ